MTTIVADIEARIAANLRLRREELGLSLGQLATRSGVSKAMIAKVESGASSPTAGLLGRLCSGLGVTLSTLMLSAEAAGTVVYRQHDQPAWRDPETSLTRTVVAPRNALSQVEIARLQLLASTVVEYEVPPIRPIRQHLYVLAGALRFTLGTEVLDLTAGDCLFAVIDRPSRFEVPASGPVEYLVIQEPA